MEKKSATTKDIVKAVAKELKIDSQTISQINNKYLEIIRRELLKGNQVKLSDFGVFEVTKWNASGIYDINTGRKIEREIKSVLFRPSKNFKKKVLR